MTANYQILNHKEADRFYWNAPTDLHYAAHQALWPLHAGECAYAASTLPMAFANQDGQWQLVAITGLAVGQNRFIKDGQWLGRYRPRSMATYGFDLHTVGKLSFLRFDLNSSLACAADEIGAQSLFNADGSLIEAVQHIQDQLLADQRLYARTEQAATALAQAGVLRPVAAEQDHTNLYLLDEAALAQLDDATFLELRKLQALGMAYAVNLSQQQYHLLERLAQINPDSVAGSSGNDEDLFGGSDTLSFNF